MTDDSGNAVTAKHQRDDGRSHDPVDLRKLRLQMVGTLVTIVRWVGSLFAAVLAVHVVLTVGGANQGNGITQFVASWANTVVLGFQNLFSPADPRLAVLVNYGLAALFWLAVTSLVVRILRSLA